MVLPFRLVPSPYIEGYQFMIVYSIASCFQTLDFSSCCCLMQGLVWRKRMETGTKSVQKKRSLERMQNQRNSYTRRGFLFCATRV
ncbi:hypothetical protein L2E82_06196 [Cichorium intybus]|uniref:Uncharacterized protein n=1 Tax=Cichorium intybus TaxID=13427 RepID=A0ACB9H9Z5_CICIN|nr:hypothetical protein L2E82_06196 [Cichorium intybus]